jgi:hypothetical protein
MHQQTKIQIKVILITIILLIIPTILVSQVSQDTKRIYKKNQIGIQLNPFINERLLSTGGLSRIDVVSSLRYGNRITKNVTTGIEFSCSFPVSTSAGQNFSIYNYFGYRIGLFTRYLYPAYSRFQIFAEASPFFSHYWKELGSSSDPTPYRDHKFGYYVAPGLSLYSKNRKISFDLYYKFSNLMFSNGNKAIVSYKVNYNF